MWHTARKKRVPEKPLKLYARKCLNAKTQCYFSNIFHAPSTHSRSLDAVAIERWMVASSFQDLNSLHFLLSKNSFVNKWWKYHSPCGIWGQAKHLFALTFQAVKTGSVRCEADFKYNWYFLSASSEAAAFIISLGTFINFYLRYAYTEVFRFRHQIIATSCV